MSSGFPNAPTNAPPGDDIDELIRMAEAGIRPPNKSKPEAPPVYNPLPTAPVSAPIADTVAAIVPTDPKPLEPETTVKVESNDKKSSKKDKDKNNRMVYSDNDVSPEEKLAKMSRYAFVPQEQKEKTILADATETPGVAGVVDA